MTRVVINQSNYLPWKGYFDLMHDADVFVFYEDVQYTKNSWRNRNRVKGGAGAYWITVPVGDTMHRLLCDVAIDDPHWQLKHWRTIEQLYGPAPYFGRYRPFLEQLYLGERWDNLSRLNQFAISTIARDFLGITARIVNSRDYARQGTGHDAILSLVQALGGQVYISGPAAKAYLDPARFEAAGIRLVWKDYSGYPEYPQRHPPFEHNVTILDLLVHTGPRAVEYIWGWREQAARREPRAAGAR